jgi:response regulator RpfG family c-di-GMP phosphodiesterase
LNYTREQVRKLLNDQRSRLHSDHQDLDVDFKKRLENIDRYLEFIVQANEPRVLEEGGVEKILEISQIQMDDFGSLLTGDETKLLTIPRGSLSEVERREIESHVTHTFNFLSRIPWASHLKAVPQIAYAHHEKLDGTGYPRSLKSSVIPIPSKMMAISDIYDALTAADRPYKKAMPSDRALSILDMEVNQGKIDPDLFKLFVEAKIFERVSRKETL